MVSDSLLTALSTDYFVSIYSSRSLLQSCVDANMNMIRIWGGGRYETDGKLTIILAVVFAFAKKLLV